MKKLLTLIAPLLLLSAAACEEKLQMKKDIYINSDAEVCGVKDPVNNIPWLNTNFNEMVARIGSNPNYAFDAYYCIYTDSVDNPYVVMYSSHGFSSVFVYDCDHNYIMGGVWNNPFSDFHRYASPARQNSDTRYEPAPDCRECYEFFDTHTFVDTIATIKYFPVSNNHK